MTTPAPIVNIPLLRKAVEWVEEQAALPTIDRQWYQGAYRMEGLLAGRSCDTVMCVAGYVADLSGVGWRGNSDVTSEREYASDVAERLLGLPPGHRLFLGDNTAADVRRIAEGIAGERL